MQSKFLLVVLVILVCGSAVVFAVENKGADQIKISATKGTVSFPHHEHQNKLGDCQLCHNLYPQVKGSIDQMKVEGKLQSKDVMNKQCLKCHRDYKKADKPSGPVSCSECHKK